MIIDGKKYFILNTDDTTYLMRITSYGILEHLYYGKRIRVTDSLDGLIERQEFPVGNNNIYSTEAPAVTLNNLCMEISSEGKGDNREAYIILEYPDGSRTSDFVFEAYTIDNDKLPLETLPSSYGLDGERQHLSIVLKEKTHNVRLVLDYYVYEKENVITRTGKLINYTEDSIKIKQFMSAQLDMYESGYVMTTFNGAWAREMSRKDIPLIAGRHINSSFTGTSSSNANPFFMLSTPYTTEDTGVAYGMNLIYSGNHVEIAEVNEFGKTRVLWGINPRGFSWTLEAEKEFECPEAVMTFSDKGFNKLSCNMHSFVRRHILRGEWALKERPVLLNSWEASYFDINEKKLLRLARAGRDVGIELFVMDDGWFGERNDDTSSLGDWTPNKKKLPSGIRGLADKVNRLGLSFGIWVEPEMVSVNSKLYKAHPDWALQIPGRQHAEGRNQRMLDLGRPEVQEYIIESMSRVFSSANIEYVKWDMNRTLSDIYSEYIGAEGNQGEVTHRYMMGLYKCMKVLTERFPDILFEGCAAGGNRFDLGILCYFPQIWGSDDTDAIVRAEIQTGYSYGYPQCCWGSHVSGVPNHQTLRVTPLRSRYSVAAFGSLGYECNLNDMSKEELAQIKSDIAEYKAYRQVFQYGQLYRGRSFIGTAGLPGVDHGFGLGGTSASGSVLTKTANNVTEWTVVSPDKKKAVGMIVQKMVVPNMPYEYYRAAGLGEDKYYHFYSNEVKVNIKTFGDLVNTASPVHIKPGSLMQETVSRVYKLDGEKEDMKLFGSAIMNAGVKLLPSFAGTGFNDKTRVFPDYSARLFFMEEEDIGET